MRCLNLIRLDKEVCKDFQHFLVTCLYGKQFVFSVNLPARKLKQNRSSKEGNWSFCPFYLQEFLVVKMFYEMSNELFFCMGKYAKARGK